MFIRCYLRASTSGQDATRAKNTLRRFAKKHDHKIASFYIENQSGSVLKRPELFRLIDDSSPGDVLLVESIDRLTRLAPNNWEKLKKAISDREIYVVSLDLPTSHMIFAEFPSDEFMNAMLKSINNMMLDMLAAMAYKDLKERARKQKEGIAKAIAEGRYKGKQRNEKVYEKVKVLTSKGFSINQIVDIVGVSRSTVMRARQSQ